MNLRLTYPAYRQKCTPPRFLSDFLWELPAAFGVLAFVSLFLRVGWTVPFTLAGSYFGVAVGFPAVASGPWGSEGPRVLICTAIGIVVGFVIGASIDRSQGITAQPHNERENEQRRDGENADA